MLDYKNVKVIVPDPKDLLFLPAMLREIEPMVFARENTCVDQNKTEVSREN